MAAIGLIYHNPKAHYLCGLALQRLGRTQEAMQAFHTALAQNPVFPDAQRALARLHTKRFEHSQAAQHEQLAQAAEQRIADFKAGRPLPEDVDLELDISLTEPASIGDLGAAVPPGPLEDAIVIVSGLPRSGTSMLMQMLAAGGLPVLTDDKRAADDSNPRGYYEFEAAKKVGGITPGWSRPKVRRSRSWRNYCPVCRRDRVTGLSSWIGRWGKWWPRSRPCCNGWDGREGVCRNGNWRPPTGGNSTACGRCWRPIPNR